MNILNKTLLLSYIIISITLVSVSQSAFAENPTPYNEWNLKFDFTNISIKQDPSNLHSLLITSRVSSIGTMPESTVNVYADVISPEGKKSTTFGTIHDLKRGETKPLRLSMGIVDEGKYTIHVRLTSVGEFTDHIFDSNILEYEVPQHGFEKLTGTIGTETDIAITYKVETPTKIQYFEVLHASVNIPAVNEFEKIIVTNGKFKQNFPMSTQDIYMTSESGYKDTKVHLLKAGKLFPLAYAQDSLLQEYVQFYKLNKDQCRINNCVNINQEKVTEEFPELYFVVLILIGISVVIGGVYVIHSKNKPKRKPDTNPVVSYIHPDKQ